MELLKETWRILTEKNEMLRTLYRWRQISQPVQIVLKSYRIPIIEYDFTHIPQKERQKIADNVDENENKVDLEQFPMRIHLCKLSEKEFEMIIDNHHIIFDGWSNAILLKELVETYSLLYQKNVPKLSSKSKYKEYIKWINSHDTEIQTNFWKTYLKGFHSKIKLPYGNYNQQKKRIEFFTTLIDEQLMNQIKNYAKQYETTSASILYCAWGILLSKYSNEEDVLFGITLSDRPHEISNVENTVGLFINTLPMRMQIIPHNTIHELVTLVGENFKKEREFSGTPMIDILTYSEIRQGENLFDSIVIVQNYPLDTLYLLENTELSLNVYSRRIETEMDLTLTLKDFGNFSLDFTYNNQRFQERDIQQIAKHLIIIINEITKIWNDKEKVKYLKDINIIDPLNSEKFKHNSSIDRKLLKQMEEEDLNEIF